jgi:hypothetical protein
LNGYCQHQFYFVSRQTNLFIMLRFAAFAALVAVAVALPAGPPAYGAPAPYHAPAPHHAPAHYDESPKPYAFQYGVADSYSGAQFNAQETADGKAVTGSYSVALPDGRIQTVTYTADHYNGYVADVSYSGEAVYPKYEPKPAYHAAPKYAPKPAYHA